VADEPQELQKIHTSCKDCIFAKYEEKTQMGCKLGRVEAFTTLGNTLEAEDDERQFFLINGRYCNAYQPETGDFAKAFKPEDWATTMRKMLQLRLSVLVVMEDGTDPQILEPTIEALLSQTLVPHQVVFINNQTAVKPAELHSRLFKQLGNTMTWRINQIFERTKEQKFVSPERAIDLAIPSVVGSYYTVIRPGTKLPQTFVKDLDVALNDKMERFSLLLPTPAGNGLTVQTDMHKHPQINGNVPSVYELDGKNVLLNTVVEKLQHYAKLEDRQYMIRSVTDICQNL